MKDKKKIENKAVTKKEVSVQRTGGNRRKVRDHYHEKHKKEDKPVTPTSSTSRATASALEVDTTFKCFKKNRVTFFCRSHIFLHFRVQKKNNQE